MVLGVELRDAREEMFVIMVCDGLPMGLAFKRAGFTSKHSNAPSNLFNLPRVQERASKILEARRTQGVVSLPEVTDMLQRVFAGAHSEGEYSAAHNAAFSLARIYGHVTDKSVVEHIRRPSRDPDAPSETALEAWAASLPIVSLDPSEASSGGPPRSAPAPLLGPGPSELSEPSNATCPGPAQDTPSRGKPQQYQALKRDAPQSATLEATEVGDGPGRTGNGAHGAPVTGTPYTGGHSGALENGAPNQTREGTGTSVGVEDQRPTVSGYGEGVETSNRPGKSGNWPKIEDLF